MAKHALSAGTSSRCSGTRRCRHCCKLAPCQAPFTDSMAAPHKYLWTPISRKPTDMLRFRLQNAADAADADAADDDDDDDDDDADADDDDHDGDDGDDDDAASWFAEIAAPLTKGRLPS
eukprot:4903751-Amphidinium_carterae.1